jgi:hypothetical protein
MGGPAFRLLSRLFFLELGNHAVPFVFPGIETVGLPVWRERGETLRRLKVVFPPTVITHSPEQIFILTAPAFYRADYQTFGREAFRLYSVVRHIKPSQG